MQFWLNMHHHQIIKNVKKHLNIKRIIVLLVGLSLLAYGANSIFYKPIDCSRILNQSYALQTQKKYVESLVLLQKHRKICAEHAIAPSQLKNADYYASMSFSAFKNNQKTQAYEYAKHALTIYRSNPVGVSKANAYNQRIMQSEYIVVFDGPNGSGDISQ